MPREPSGGRVAVASPDRLALLRKAAEGWHQIQLAVLGFIGFCGIFRSDADGVPRKLQILSAAMAVAALAVACLGIYLVGRVAWPPRRDDLPSDEREEQIGERRLDRGRALTFVALALMVLATLSGWWPKK